MLTKEQEERKAKYLKALAVMRATANPGCKVCFGKGYITGIQNTTGKRTDMQCRCSWKRAQNESK